MEVVHRYMNICSSHNILNCRKVYYFTQQRAHMDSSGKIVDFAELRKTKIKIRQDVPNSCMTKGPHAIMRRASLNDGICIKRRHGNCFHNIIITNF